jgi:nitroimidazol reductase NimA-like FMN-containing flavoprotein (pyridoxamine 5'-phosphate oxidase superfamily)
LADRGAYDRTTVQAILDEALICHVGFVADGHPIVIPTIHARIGDALYLHGSPANRMLRAIRDGAEMCLTATLVDGLVLARSAFHHSMNYRSVVVFGRAALVDDPAEKDAAFRALVEHVRPGRYERVRPPTTKEAKGTLLVRLALHEASAKIRTGPPIDEEADLEWPVWAGEIPLRLVAGAAVPDPHCRADVPGPN